MFFYNFWLCENLPVRNVDRSFDRRGVTGDTKLAYLTKSG